MRLLCSESQGERQVSALSDHTRGGRRQAPRAGATAKPRAAHLSFLLFFAETGAGVGFTSAPSGVSSSSDEESADMMVIVPATKDAALPAPSKKSPCNKTRPEPDRYVIIMHAHIMACGVWRDHGSEHEHVTSEAKLDLVEPYFVLT